MIAIGHFIPTALDITLGGRGNLIKLCKCRQLQNVIEKARSIMVMIGISRMPSVLVGADLSPVCSREFAVQSCAVAVLI